MAWADAALAGPPDPTWRLEEGGGAYQPALEHELGSRFALGNGFLGVRASLDIPAPASQPGTFVAGLFTTPDLPFSTPALVAAPDWTALRLSIDGQPVPSLAAGATAHPRMLDYRRGVLLGVWHAEGPAGQFVQLRTVRCLSSADRRLALQIARITVDRPVWLTLEALDGAAGANLLDQATTEDQVLSWRVAQSPYCLALARQATLTIGGRRLAATPTAHGLCWSWLATPAAPALFTRLVAVARGLQADRPQVLAQVVAAQRRAARCGPARLLAAHTRAWTSRQAAGDVIVAGDPEAQTALRFAVHHLTGAVNPADASVSIGARGLTGEAYRGHVFWDTECFALPFYTLTWPAAARALLMYRYHTLPAARAKAARLGYRGALYAWESTDTGAEATPAQVLGPRGAVITIRCGTEEQHISADIALAVWRYWDATHDTAFLRDAGAEILFETARFWASRAVREADGRWHIRGVIGPDEYHETIDDNAYTNGMAAWNLERGAEIARLLRARWPARWATLSATLALTEPETAHWRELAAGLVTGFDPATGLIEQFAGFFQLEPVEMAAYATRTAPMDVVLGSERTRQTQVIKQADVVMLLANLWEQYSPSVRAANFRYYEPRCGHGSSLSPAVHALVAARLGRVALAERYFHQAGAIDLDDTIGNAAGGVHLGALGGLWQAAVLGFAGLALEPAGLRLAPHLPETWQTLRFTVRWRQRTVRLAIAAGAPGQPPVVSATLERGRPLTIALGARRHLLRPGSGWTGEATDQEATW
jgi:trehalose/maltose hydrolase-like predicted phosphorylase